MSDKPMQSDASSIVDTFQNVPESTYYKKQGSFVAFVSLDCRHFSGLEHKRRNVVVPRTLVAGRWDGKFGFPGGRMDQGEGPREAAIREIKEEIGATILERELKHVSSFCKNDFVSNLYRVDVPWSNMEIILQNSYKGTHYSSEISGLMAFFLTLDNMEHYNKLPWAFSAGVEFNAIIGQLYHHMP